MAKVDITVSRTLTVNTGNYESIKPTVSLSVKDVDPNNLSDAYLSMDTALTGLLKLEILACNQELNQKSDAGLTSYCGTINENLERIGQLVERHLIELDKI